MYIISTDQQRVVMSSPLPGKKPGQRKRKGATKTLLYKILDIKQDKDPVLQCH